MRMIMMKMKWIILILKGVPTFFCSPVPSSTGKQLEVTLNNVSRVSPLYGSRKSALLVATPTKRRV